MSNSRRLRGLLALLLGSAALTVAVTAGPARAATDTGSAAPAAEALCHWNDAPAFGGTWLCRYGRHLATLSGGTRVGFVIGVDYSVRYRSVDAAGKFGDWHTLKGTITHGADADASTFKVTQCAELPDLVGVFIVGKDGQWWGKRRNVLGEWGSWSHAAPQSPC